MRGEFQKSIWYTTGERGASIQDLIKIEGIAMTKAIAAEWKIYENPRISLDFPQILNYAPLCKN